VSRRKPVTTAGTRPRAKKQTAQSRSARPANAQPRQQRPQKQKRERKPIATSTKVLVLIGLTVTTLLLGGNWILHRSIFNVKTVHLYGVVHEDPKKVLKASGLQSHPSLISVSGHSIEHNLSSFRWISGVSVTKQWPSTVNVTIHETRPVAVAFNGAHVLEYVAANGADLGPAPMNANYPTLVYLNPLTTTWPFRKAGYSAVYVADRLPKSFAWQISKINVGANGSVTLEMESPVSFVLGPATKLKEKFVAIASVIAHTTLKAGDVVNVEAPTVLSVTGPPPS